MSVPFSGILRLPSVLRMASGRRGDAVGASGNRARKSATASTSERPIARNSFGAMTAGAQRLRERSAALAFVLPVTLTRATFDFGKSLTHVGAQKHIIEIGR